MSELLTRDQRRRALAAHPVFGAVGPENLERLADLADAVALRAGDTLITEGDPAGDVYVLLAGRLEAWVLRASGVRSIVGEIGPGEIVGEMSMLSELPRSASVGARRDSTLLRLPRRRFLDLITHDADALLAMTRQLVHRIESANRAADRRPSLRTIAVVAARTCPDLRAFADDLGREFGSDGRVEIVDRRRAAEALGEDVVDAAPGTAESRRLVGYLHDLEAGGSVVIFVADGEPSPWTERCVRQADHILLVGSGAAPEPTEVERRLLFSDESHVRAAVDLVLVHDRSAVVAGTAGWLSTREVTRHHHVTSGGAGLRRLVRRLRGDAVGLVLSGGGARGFAHIGVARALREAGIDFDVYAGASFGASVAAQLALGWPPEQILEAEVKATVEIGSLLDITFPYVSLAKGRTLTRGISGTLGSTRIEDLPTEFFCVSSDLTAGRLEVHRRGVLADAVRASVAIPGIFPPVRSADGHVLVDGGIMDNLPVSEMRQRLDGGRVVAVDLRTRNELPAAELPAGGVASGWPPLLRRFNPMRSRMEVPRIIDLLIRSTEMASGDRHDTADVVLRPPVEGFGLLEFAAYAKVEEAGYRYAVDFIESEGTEAFVARGT